MYIRAIMLSRRLHAVRLTRRRKISEASYARSLTIHASRIARGQPWWIAGYVADRKKNQNSTLPRPDIAPLPNRIVTQFRLVPIYTASTPRARH